MRPLALVAVFAALAGCSLNYEGKTFKAIEKPHHMAEGTEHPINDEKGEHEATDPAGGHDGEKASVEPSFEQTQPVVRTSASFPKGVQPTGKPPVIPKSEYVEGNPSMTKVEGE